MFYTEGTVDAIDFGPTTICFSILPSAEFLQTLDGNEKMVLFIKDADKMMSDDSEQDVHDADVLPSRSAKLVKPVKNASGKEVLWFQLTAGLSFCPRNVLLDAKNNRSTVRVRVCNPDRIDEVKDSNPTCKSIPAQSLRIN